MIRIKDLTIRRGDFQLTDVSLSIPTGTYAALMGRTGSGKTTLLEAIAGLKPIVRGRIELNGIDVTRRKPAERNLGYVPQDGALFPTLTVYDHLAFALVIRHMPRKQINARVHELAELLEIKHLLNRRTQGLSGGERQRVALGRALSFQPATLCLDEPLSALDDETRQQMYELLDLVRRQTGVTTLHVTHNQEEADRLADLIYRVDHGTVMPAEWLRQSQGQPAGFVP